MPPDYGEWAKTCRNHSLNMSEKYPSQKASRVILPSLAVPADASDPTSKAKVASAILGDYFLHLPLFLQHLRTPQLPGHQKLQE